MKVLLPLIALLAGCAAQVPAGSAKPVPADRLVGLQTPAAARVVVTRDSGIEGGGCPVKLAVNGVDAATFGTGETATFHVPAGETLLKVSRGGGLCMMSVVQRETMLKTGETKQFRILMGYGGVDIVRAD